MKVLWLCNGPLPDAARELNISAGVGGGWLTAEFEQLKKKPDIELFACFPLRGTKVIQKIHINGATHYSVPRRVHSFFKYDSSMEKFFKAVVNEVKPDVIHIHGTENTPAWSLMKACPDYTYVVSLQGIVSMIAVHQHSALPFGWQITRTPWDLVAGTSSKKRAKMFRISGKYEQKVIRRADYLMGRTDWDKLCSEMLGATGKYVFSPEILRKPFYNTRWTKEDCQKDRIFSSVGTSAIKGAHFLLEAVAMLKEEYPDIKICFAGKDTYGGGIKTMFRRTGYAKYIHKLISKFDLGNNITFLGNLSAEEMAMEMRKANVYAHPSSIDNSPNSLAEAMMVGTPCVASYVGGIPSMIENNKEGLLYSYDAPYWLAYNIRRIFEDTKFAEMLSENAHKRAEADHPISGADITYNLYKEIEDSKSRNLI